MSDPFPRPWPIPGAVYQSLTAAPGKAASTATIPIVSQHVNFQIARPSAQDAAELLAFELENRAYFERWINPRAHDYYSFEGISTAIGAAARDAAADVSHQFLVKIGGAIVGRVNLNHVLRPYFNKVELGYRMGERHAGKGYATQAVALALAEALGSLKFARVEATVRAVNRASLRVLEKNGFEEFGRSERSIQFKGEWCDLLHLVGPVAGQLAPAAYSTEQATFHVQL